MLSLRSKFRRYHERRLLLCTESKILTITREDVGVLSVAELVEELTLLSAAVTPGL